MESIAYTSETCAAHVVASVRIWDTTQLELMRTSTTRGLGAASAAPSDVVIEGTRVSTIAPTAYKATALLPISGVVVFDGFAGIRSWSPPV